MFTVSQAAIESVLREMQQDRQTGNTDYVDQFFACRPDWIDQGENAAQADTQDAEKQKTA